MYGTFWKQWLDGVRRYPENFCGVTKEKIEETKVKIDEI